MCFYEQNILTVCPYLTSAESKVLQDSFHQTNKLKTAAGDLLVSRTQKEFSTEQHHTQDFWSDLLPMIQCTD